MTLPLLLIDRKNDKTTPDAKIDKSNPLLSELHTHSLVSEILHSCLFAESEARVPTLETVEFGNSYMHRLHHLKDTAVSLRKFPSRASTPVYLIWNVRSILPN